MVAMDIHIADTKRKRALLIHYADNDVDQIFETLSHVGEDKDYDVAKNKLSEYFEPRVNTSFWNLQFLKCKATRK